MGRRGDRRAGGERRRALRLAPRGGPRRSGERSSLATSRRAGRSRANRARLPTFGYETLARVQALLEGDALAGFGGEPAVIVDLRDNDGGSVALELLLPWLSDLRDASAEALMPGRRTLVSSCLADTNHYRLIMPELLSGPTPPPTGALRARTQQLVDSVFEASAPECPVTEQSSPSPRAYRDRPFAPREGRPIVVALTNGFCGSDCEAAISILRTQPEVVVVGANTYGVAEFIQPWNVVLPHSRVPFRVARGTSDVYGDARPFDGYGLDVDVVLDPRAPLPDRDTLVALARALVARCALP